MSLKKVLILFSISVIATLSANSIYDLIEKRNQLKYDENRINNRAVQLEYDKYMDDKRKEDEATKARVKKEKEEEKARQKQMRINTNKSAKNANQKYYDEIKRKSRNDSAPSNNISNYVKKTYNPKDYIGKPQLVLGGLHILGIKSIQQFKNNKLMIKAANGTFALPRDKFDKAEKINFTDEMKKGSL